MGLRVVYYISPQIWAWRRGRVKHIARDVDHMIVIFPFEEEFYREHGVPVTYVGHPLIEQVAGVTPRALGTGTDAADRAPSGIAAQRGRRRFCRPMLDAIAVLQKERSIDAFVIQAPTIRATELLAIMERCGTFVRDHPARSRRSHRRRGRRALILGHGHAGMRHRRHTGRRDVPAVAGDVSGWRRELVKLPYFSLVNIIAGKRGRPRADAARRQRRAHRGRGADR